MRFFFPVVSSRTRFPARNHVGTAWQGSPRNGSFPKLGYLFGYPRNKDDSFFGFTLGSPVLENYQIMSFVFQLASIPDHGL